MDPLGSLCPLNAWICVTNTYDPMLLIETIILFHWWSQGRLLGITSFHLRKLELENMVNMSGYTFLFPSLKILDFPGLVQVSLSSLSVDFSRLIKESETWTSPGFHPLYVLCGSAINIFESEYTYLQCTVLLHRHLLYAAIDLVMGEFIPELQTDFPEYREAASSQRK